MPVALDFAVVAWCVAPGVLNAGPRTGTVQTIRPTGAIWRTTRGTPLAASRRAFRNYSKFTVTSSNRPTAMQPSPLAVVGRRSAQSDGGLYVQVRFPPAVVCLT